MIDFLIPRYNELYVNDLILLIKKVSKITKSKVAVDSIDMSFLIKHIEKKPAEINDILINHIKYSPDTLALVPNKIKNLLVLI